MADLLPPWPIPPGLLLILGAPFLVLLTGTPRKILHLLIPALVLAQVLSLYGGASFEVTFEWMGFSLSLLEVDRTRLFFGTIFAGVALINSLYALHREDPVEKGAGWLYAGSSLGVTFAGDLLAFVLFWELMGVGSVLLVLVAKTARTRSAAIRYAAWHVLGGTVLLAGVLAWVVTGNDLSITAFATDAGWPAWLILFGVALNAAVVPLHTWLPDAYADALPTGAAFLAAYTTKVAVFAMMMLFPGWPILLWAGTIMAIYGVSYAIVENRIRRILSYHIVSQVGFMVAGIGVGTAIALDGSAAHAYFNILYKGLLFMAAGAIAMATGTDRLTELGGLARRMPFLLVLYGIGAASIAGTPLFNGYVSKGMLVYGASSAGHYWVEIGLLVASIGTFLSIGLKVIWFGFFGKPREYNDLEPLPWNVWGAMVLAAVPCIVYGVWPALLQLQAPFESAYRAYTLHNLIKPIELLTMTGLGFMLLVKIAAPKPGFALDLDWLVRWPLAFAGLKLSRAIVRGQELIGARASRLVITGHILIQNPLSVAERVMGRGIFGRREVGAANVAPELHPEDTYRLPLGPTIAVVILLFGAVALLQLLVNAAGQGGA